MSQRARGTKTNLEIDEQPEGSEHVRVYLYVIHELLLTGNVDHYNTDLLTFWLHCATCECTKEAYVKHCVSDNKRLNTTQFRSLCLLHDVVSKFLSSST